ncbi:nucleoside recognition domain-containing protein [Chitinophaga sancti]|uniref:Nucleoside recognition domain-containing protein n=1 Tax=Chitinophaga sancti TaxID=1004 RepID=A0A1K1N893_9BACT|nr:spore maturation protein [Chitinophaga sancti]WQD63475.1 nucleoside recognition domain-containing protein [Chitinophaga sancti]WQG90899.1 nucleoside recognition domain-containing protein [Chitinophaga sancti]SFW31453.1 Spore maturation protein SpmA [Chitinophaga sancti]
MALNYVWLAFFLISFVVALFKLIVLGDTTVFSTVMTSMFDSAKTGAEISLGLAGIMTFWLGMMKVGEKAGMIEVFAKAVTPFFSKLFPSIPKGNPAMGSMLMNFSANALGLDNAATPLGLKAMKQLQEINKEPETASDAQIMFLVLNTAGITLIPTSVIAIRLAQHAANPADIFIPTLIGTLISFISGMIAVAIYQRLNLFKLPVLIFLGIFGALLALLYYAMHNLPAEQIATYTSLIGGLVIFSIIVSFLTLGLIKKVNVYDVFIEGAKEGFQTSVMIIPYLVAMLCGIAAFRATGCLDYVTGAIGAVVGWMGLNTDFVPVLPVGIMKTFSGGAARGLMVDTIVHYGVDSFQGKLASVIQGSTETTFYILAVYFGSVNIKNTRYALTCGLIADVVGLIGAIIIGYIFFWKP